MMDKQDVVITSLREESVWRGPNVRRPERHVTLPLDDFINENEDEEVEDLDHASINQGDRFWLLRNRRDEGFWQDENFSHSGVGSDFGYHDGLDRNLGSIKMKIPAFQGRNDL